MWLPGGILADQNCLWFRYNSHNQRLPKISPPANWNLEKKVAAILRNEKVGI